MSEKALPNVDNQNRLSLRLLWVMAIGAGVGVANVYYVQPVVPLVQAALGATFGQTTLIPAASQTGYAVGMLLLAPLGDLMDRKRLVTLKCLLLTVALLVTATAPNITVLLLSSLILGLLASVGQDFIPLAAQMAPPERRGRAIGIVTTGLLCGILLSRTLGGAVGELAGWRAIYWIAAAMVAVVGSVVWRSLPSQPAATDGSYASLLRSLGTLVYREPTLRKALATQTLLASTLGAFWSTLALMLAEPPFQFSSGAAGAFGLAGAAGALGASLFGSIADSRGALAMIRAGSLLVTGAFGLMLIFPGSLVGLIVGAVLFDLGVMAGLVSHQTIVTSIDPNARSRLNGLLMTAAMIGVSLGALIGGWAWSAHGWVGVCLASVFAGLLAFLRSYLPPFTPVISKETNT